MEKNTLAYYNNYGKNFIVKAPDDQTKHLADKISAKLRFQDRLARLTVQNFLLLVLNDDRLEKNNLSPKTEI